MKTLSFAHSLAVSKLCSLLLPLSFLPMQAFIWILSVKARHQLRMRRQIQSDMLAVDLEVLTSLYGKNRKRP